MSLILKILKDRPLLFDGAMGTMIEEMGLGGHCNEEICLSKPQAITDIHRRYLDAGADIITTNTFGASRITLVDHGLAERTIEINRAAATIARASSDAVSSPSRPRFVAGELGPTSKLPTLGHIQFDQMFDAYVEQTSALIGGGVDLIIIATCQDPLQAKAAAAAACHATSASQRRIPLFISITVSKNGTMLLGTEVLAALATVAPFKPDAFGINCSLGPDKMEEYIHLLSLKSPFPVLCRPNAGMPENVAGRPTYPMGPDEFGRILGGFARRFSLAIVGGCCGTTPAHISALAKELSHRCPGAQVPRRPGAQAPRGKVLPMVSTLYTAIELDQVPRPFIIAEQTNANGSKKFKDLLTESNYDAMAEIARQAADSSHALDICVAYAGRQEREDITEVIRRVVPKSQAAIMIDSTDPQVICAALSLIPGRAIINSINLEDGGDKAREVIAIARRFGAVVVGLTIDERGMAKDVEAKLSVAERIVALVLKEGLDLDDLIIDPLTFTLASGDSKLRDAGIQTLEAIREIKKRMSGVRTLLGVSNISFGLPPAGRRVLTSVFLERALEAGLDAAIINPRRIIPIPKIPENEVELCNRLIANDHSDGDPLAQIIERFTHSARRTTHDARRTTRPPEDKLKRCIIDGSVEGLTDILEKLLVVMEPTEIINRILLPAMNDVGECFGKGQLPLPFVLQSAEVMRTACDLLAPHMGDAKAIHRGTIVLATVRGDVHDIGKNLVDIILSNNGFNVANLGIRQPAEAIIEAAILHHADAIGLSGLLVSSTEIMRGDLEIFRERGLSIPVLCGGAALTSSFVEDALTKAYGGRVYYCADAFAGLAAMKEIVK